MKKVKKDIRKYERDTKNKFRTAHKWVGKFYSHVVTKADIS